jgi:hypothetical protein
MTERTDEGVDKSGIRLTRKALEAPPPLDREETTDPGNQDDGLRLTREVLWALPPLGREDGAVAAMVEGMLEAAELLQEDDSEGTES